MTSEEIVEARRRCRTEYFYLSEILGYDFQRDVHADLFEALHPAGRTSRLILWSRGHYKTSAVSVAVVQRILNNPDARIVLMQGNLKLTKGWLAEIRSHFTGKNTKSRLPELFPDFCGGLVGDAFAFTVGNRKRALLKEATVTAASPKAISTGQHYTDLYADDLVNTNNFRNVELLDKLDNEFQHFVPLIDPGGYITVTGTRYSHADIYGRIIARDKDRGEWVVSVRPCYKADGTLLFPERVLPDGRKIGFTVELLASIQRDDPETFAAQYLNQIIPTKHHLFPESLLLSAVKSTKDDDYPAAAPCIFAVDLAEGKKADSDHSVVAVGRADGLGRSYVVDVVGGTLSPSTLVTTIIEMALLHRPKMIWVEKQPGAEFFVDYLRKVGREKGVNLPVEMLKSSNQKNAKYLRVAALEGPFKNKRLFLMAGIRDFDRLLEEFSQFPRGRHDDRPDCIALLVKALGEHSIARPVPTRKLPYFFDVPYSTEQPDAGPDNPMGYGFSC